VKTWDNRSFEFRNLFNPAFCGVILLRAFQGFEEIDDSGMPFSLALLVLPLCLHKETREIISNHSRSYFIKTINDKPQILIDFSERTTRFLPYTMEGLGLAMHFDSFKVTDSGHLKLQKKGIRKKIEGTREAIECQKVARIIGKSFAKINDRVTIYTTLGIRP